MGERLAAPAAGLVVAIAILVAAGGNALRPELFGMALIAGWAFFDLARRGFAETGLGDGDRTDLGMSAAFAVVLVGAAWDHGRDVPAGWHGGLELTFLAVGVACLAAGGAIRTWASRTLGSDFLVRLDLRDEHRLVETGPFRRVRHPTYAALLLMAVGTGLCFGSPLALAATVLLWIPAMVMRVGREERQLAARYGRVYDEYRRRTWRLVPGIY